MVGHHLTVLREVLVGVGRFDNLHRTKSVKQGPSRRVISVAQASYNLLQLDATSQKHQKHGHVRDNHVAVK